MMLLCLTHREAKQQQRGRKVSDPLKCQLLLSCIDLHSTKFQLIAGVHKTLTHSTKLVSRLWYSLFVVSKFYAQEIFTRCILIILVSLTI